MVIVVIVKVELDGIVPIFGYRLELVWHYRWQGRIILVLQKQ